MRDQADLQVAVAWLPHERLDVAPSRGVGAPCDGRRRWSVVCLDTDGITADTLRRHLHDVVQLIAPLGTLITTGPLRHHQILDDFDLVLDAVASTDSEVFRVRPDRYNVHDLVFDARSTIERVAPHELAEQLGTASAPMVVDIRTDTDRCRTGVIEGSIHAPRTVLEWHLDPANGYLHPHATSFDRAFVVVCNGGYSSSLAAASLVRLGFTSIADLIGGIEGWRGAGLPLVEPDHSHLGP